MKKKKRNREEVVKKIRGVTDLDRKDFERWKAGTSLAEIARERKVKRRFVAQPFHKLAGGKEKFKALRAAGAGGKAFGGMRGGGRTRETVQHDDSKVKRVHSSPRWKIESVWEPCTVKIKDQGVFSWRREKLRIFISPKNNKYVRAKDMEKADLLVVVEAMSLPDKQGVTHRLKKCDSVLRLKRLENSSLVRKLKQEENVVERGLKARAARKQAKLKKKKHIAKLSKK